MAQARKVSPPAPLAAEVLESVPGVLGDISRERAADYKGMSVTKLVLSDIPRRASFAAALRKPGLSIIAEVKRSSPSQGQIASLNPVDAAEAYARGGARAISVLTEERHFGGRLEYLGDIADTVELPLLRKDFTVHPQQIVEAKGSGASAVLLIVAALQEATADYLAYAKSFGMDALVEVHDAYELDIALASGADIIGVNNRNLQTLAIDTGNAPRLIEKARAEGFEGLLVAESGYKDVSELIPLKGVADAVLIGTSLAGSGTLEAGVRKLVKGLA